MKLRIHKNTLRFRLDQSEVQQLKEQGFLEESLSFGASPEGLPLQFKYGVYSLSESESKSDSDSNSGQTGVEYSNHRLSLLVPSSLLQEWATSNQIDLHWELPLLGTLETPSSLLVWLEKDLRP